MAKKRMKFEYYVLATWRDTRTGVMKTDLSFETTSYENALNNLEYLYNEIDWGLEYADEIVVNGRLYGFEHQGTRFSVVYVPED